MSFIESGRSYTSFIQ